jgi:hypothetical protein
MDGVTFNSTGNEITLVKRAKAGSDGTAADVEEKVSAA